MIHLHFYNCVCILLQEQTTPLIIASENGNLSTVNVLLKHGSIVDHQNQVEGLEANDFETILSFCHALNPSFFHKEFHFCLLLSIGWNFLSVGCLPKQALGNCSETVGS